MFPRCIRPILLPWYAAIGLVVSSTLALPALAEWAPVVENHQLDCKGGFSCPKEIQRRVDFWIQVFRQWDTGQLIFHDSKNPHRVYSVIRTESQCTRRRPGRRVRNERAMIKQQLESLAVALNSGDKQLTQKQQALLNLFPSGNSKKVRAASKRIRCQRGNRDRFLEALKRWGRYRANILYVLRDHKLSDDIQYLPFVESAYNPLAYSKVGAAGLWQIMPRTARNLGLQLNASIDERFDPEAATLGAARYLRNSTDSLTAAAKLVRADVTAEQLTPFIITSYNYGVAGMRRAINKVGPDYVQVLKKYKSKTFRTAVRNFYSSFLAARYVAKNSKKYFSDYKLDHRWQYSPILLTRASSVKRVSKVFGVDKKELKRLNPGLTRYVWKGWRLIPEGYRLRLPYRNDHWDRQIIALNKLPIEQPQLSGRRYVVQRGDTACAVARAFNVKCRDLIQVNALGRRALIRIGQRLEIPGKPAKRPILVAAAGPAAKPATMPPTVDLVAEASAKQLSDVPAGTPQTATDPTAIASLNPKNTTVGELEPKSGQASRPSLTIPAAAITSESATPLDIPAFALSELMAKLMTGNGKGYYLRVLPEETLGHYADWLGGGTTGYIRRLNKMGRKHSISVNQRIILPIERPEQKQDFETKRAEYHRTLVDEFREHFEVRSLEYYRFKPGDSLWRVARDHELPYWILVRYNPSISTPRVGEKIIIPKVATKKS